MNHNRRSIRLQNYNYSLPGAYFVTVCTWGRECLFGDIVNGKMQLNDAGHAVEQCWQAIPGHFPHVELDVFVVMPNHIHGILNIFHSPVEVKNLSYGKFPAKQMKQRPCGTSKSIGSIIRGFKIGVTKWMRVATNAHDVWQRNFWEHVVRNDIELGHIREYIENNPVQWELDKLHPDNNIHMAQPVINKKNTVRPCLFRGMTQASKC